MTEDDIKEALSDAFISLIAYAGDFGISKHQKDYGVDISLVKYIRYKKPVGDGYSYMPDPKQIEIQLKSTTEKQIIRDPTHLTYQLRAKNYNDLATRSKIEYTPLVLVLFVLPDDRIEWLEIGGDDIKLRKHAYWYILPPNSPTTDNSSTKTIKIPLSNLIDINFCDSIHKLIYK